MATTKVTSEGAGSSAPKSAAPVSGSPPFINVLHDYALVGSRSGRKFNMGDKVIVKVAAANLDKRQLDFEWEVNGMLNK